VCKLVPEREHRNLYQPERSITRRVSRCASTRRLARR